MDPESVITQASPDAPSVNTNGNTPVSNEALQHVDANGEHSRRGLLASILCCGCGESPDARADVKRNGEDGGSALPPASPSSQGANSSGACDGLLGAVRSMDDGKKCVVIDLDETLVHSSFKPVPNADFVVPVEIDGVVHQVFVLKRPHVDQFLKRMGELFECVLFTASLAKYADPVSDLLDRTACFRWRLFREACVYHRGNYVKDLSRLGRDISNTVIIDNSPASYMFHPDNAVPVGSWFDDPNDTELLDLLPFFEGLSKVERAVEVLRQT